MNKSIKHFFRRGLIMLSLIFVFADTVMAQSMISMSTANCTISSNEVQMDILVKNTGTIDLRWNSCALRMTVPAAMIPAGTQTYSFNYLGGSDFPLSWPLSYPSNSFGSGYNAATNLLTWTTGYTSAYNNATCSAPLIIAGETKTIGRFSFKITSSLFVAGAAANFVWHTTSSCNFYQACAVAVTGYGQQSGLRTLINPCGLIVPFSNTCNGAYASITQTTAVSTCGAADGTGTININNVGANEQGTYTIDGGAVQSFASNPFTITGLSSGNHSLSIYGSFSNAVCPSLNGVFNIGSPGAITGTYSTTQSGLCNGVVDLNTGSITITPSGGTAPYSYSWTGPNGYTAGNSATVSNLPAGIYNVSITSANLCTGNIIGIPVTASNVIQVSSGSTNTCSNTGSITLSVSGGTGPYTYSLDGTNYQASNFFNNLSVGSYIGYVKDANGCIGNRTVSVSQPSILVSAYHNTFACPNTGVVTLNANGGSRPYTYSLDGTNYQADSVFYYLASGLSYTGYVKDALGCIGESESFGLAWQPIILSFDLTQPSACIANGIIQVLVISGGNPPYTYRLDGSPSQASPFFYNVGVGNHSVSAKDATGCDASTRPFYVGNRNIIVVPYSYNSSSCNATGSIDVYVAIYNCPSCTVGTLSYSLDNINYQYSNHFNNLPAGNYTAYVKDGLGCIGSSPPIIVNQDPVIELSARYTNASSCLNDGTIQANDPIGGQAPFTYSLNGTTFQASKSFSGLAAGTYTLTAKDINGCIATTSVTIAVNQVNVTSYAWNASSCTATNGKIQLFVTGGVNPYAFSIDGVTYQTSTNMFTNLAPGTYTGFIKDAKGCIGTKTGIVVGPAGCAPTFTNNTQKIPENTGLKIQAYPNPTNTDFLLVLEGYNSKEKISVVVTDQLGRKVYQSEGTGKLQYRFGQNFIAGMYHVKVVQGNEKRSINIVKE